MRVSSGRSAMAGTLSALEQSVEYSSAMLLTMKEDLLKRLRFPLERGVLLLQLAVLLSHLHGVVPSQPRQADESERRSSVHGGAFPPHLAACAKGGVLCTQTVAFRCRRDAARIGTGDSEVETEFTDGWRQMWAQMQRYQLRIDSGCQWY